MKRRWIRSDECGVAMVTVLLIGASLTAVTSVATFATMREFNAARDDRRGTAALANAEAGIDRFVQYLKSGLINFNTLNSAGCGGRDPLAVPIGDLGDGGSYTASLTVYDPYAVNPLDRFPPAACANRPVSPHPGQDTDPNTPGIQGGDQTFFVITATGQRPLATRVVRQVIAVSPVGLPIGLYANSMDPQANITYTGVSAVVESTVRDRKFMTFVGDDNYYKVSDFFSEVGVTGKALDAPVPAAVHAGGQILMQPSRDPEFTGGATGTKNCTANGNSQSLWDSDGSSGSGPITSGCAPNPSVFPNSSRFTATQLARFANPNLSPQDRQVLKDAARAYGLYCSISAGAYSCVQQGTPIGSNWEPAIQGIQNSGTLNFVAYFEFETGNATVNDVDWPPQQAGTVWPCHDNPDLTRSIVAVVENGGITARGAGGSQVNGAFIVDGDFEATGGFEFNGTIVAGGEQRHQSSSSSYSLSPCWVKNMPGPFLSVEQGHWSEVDR